MAPKTDFLGELIEAVTERGRRMLRLSPLQVETARKNASLVTLAEELLSGKGEASGYARAQVILERYEASSAEERLAFLQRLAVDFGARPAVVAAAVSAYRNDPAASKISALHRAAEPRRQELIRRLNLASSGTAALVRMRAELLEQLPRHPALKELDEDFVHLFSSWFNRGFLLLRTIDWQTPALILERIIQYEAVHAIRDWDDLRGRIEPPDRRCFAFFHPALADEPLIFVEVALTTEIPDKIAPLIAPGRTAIDPGIATTAVFYSISSCQRGLAGIFLGNFLIKQVADDLRRTFPRLVHFVTLSPVPGFANWLKRDLGSGHDVGLVPEQAAMLAKALLQPHWSEDAKQRSALKPALEIAAARYFLHAKGANGLPVDPVARFHLGNGARLDRLNHLGDPSPKGLMQSHGLMVNYRYDLATIEENHEAYAERGFVAASRAIHRILPSNDPSVKRRHEASTVRAS